MAAPPARRRGHGVLSAFGIGGGSVADLPDLLAALDQHQAQGINLLYFLPPPLPCLLTRRMDYWSKAIILPAVVTGLAVAGLTAWLSNALDTSVLRKLFGLFLLYIGLTELFRKDKPTQDTKDSPPAPNGKRTGTKASPLFFSAYVLHSAGYPVTVLRICFILIASKVRNINTKAMGKAMNALGMNPAIR